jgi:hypothetical protein
MVARVTGCEVLPLSPAARLDMLIDMGPPHIVGYDEDTGEPVYRGAGILSAEQVRSLLNRVGDDGA